MENVTPLKLLLFFGYIILICLIPGLFVHGISLFIKKDTGINISPFTADKYSAGRGLGILLTVVCFFLMAWAMGEVHEYRGKKVEKQRQAEKTRENHTAASPRPETRNNPSSHGASEKKEIVSLPARDEASPVLPSAATLQAEAAPQLTPAQRTRMIAAQFDPQSGAHLKLENFIKKQKEIDPRTYRHDQTSFVDEGDYLVVTTTFFADEASLPAKHEWIVKVDLSGYLLQVISKKSAVVK